MSTRRVRSFQPSRRDRLYRPLTAAALVASLGIAVSIGSCAALGFGSASKADKDYEAPVNGPVTAKLAPTPKAQPVTPSPKAAGDIDPVLSKVPKRRGPAPDRPEGDPALASAANNLQEMFEQIQKATAEAQSPTPPAGAGAELGEPAVPVEKPLISTLRPVQRPGRPAVMAPTMTAAAIPAPASHPTPAPEQTLTSAASVAPVPAPAPATAAPPKPEPTPAQKKADAVAELVKQLKPDVSAVSRPLAAAVPLIGLETIQPGSAATDLDALASAAPRAQSTSITAVREVVKAAANDPALADPAALAKLLRDQADRLNGGVSASESLALGSVALCQRVDGFGRFTPLGSTSFQAGRAASMILYTEVLNFAQRPAAALASAEPADLNALPDSQWAVEVGQELQLILDADGSTQWRSPEGSVRDVSRSRRSDYYLVQRVDLPKNLSVGKYTLKVIVRDKAAGAETETNIPIQIVADPASVKR